MTVGDAFCQKVEICRSALKSIGDSDFRFDFFRQNMSISNRFAGNKLLPVCSNITLYD